MSWDVDEKEFYETFAEITQDRGLDGAKEWAWSALHWTQQELRERDKENLKLRDTLGWINTRQRAIACKGWRWMPGMRCVRNDGLSYVVVCAVSASKVKPTWLPDLQDPATLGCVLALVREAWGMPTGITVSYSSDDGLWGVSWSGATHGSWCGRGKTEDEALVAALESAP